MPDKLKKKGKIKWRDVLFILVMLALPVLFVGVFFYYPILSGIPNAFRNYSLWDLSKTRWIGFGNFVALSRNFEFRAAVPNTLIWVFVSLFFQFIIGFTLALFLKRKFRGRGMYQGMIFFPWAISGFLIGIIWRWMYNGVYGPLNDILIRLSIVSRANPLGFLSNPNLAMPSVLVTNIWYGIAFFAIMLQAALQGVPDELYEAASVDGAGKVYQFFRITVPYIYPVIILTTLLRSIWIFNFADLIYALTKGGPGGSTQILTSYMMNLIIFNSDFGMASAVGLIICIILLIWAALYMYLTRFEEMGDF